MPSTACTSCGERAFRRPDGTQLCKACRAGGATPPAATSTPATPQAAPEADAGPRCAVCGTLANFPEDPHYTPNGSLCDGTEIHVEQVIGTSVPSVIPVAAPMESEQVLVLKQARKDYEAARALLPEFTDDDFAGATERFAESTRNRAFADLVLRSKQARKLLVRWEKAVWSLMYEEEHGSNE